MLVVDALLELFIHLIPRRPERRLARPQTVPFSVCSVSAGTWRAATHQQSVLHGGEALLPDLLDAAVNGGGVDQAEKLLNYRACEKERRKHIVRADRPLRVLSERYRGHFRLRLRNQQVCAVKGLSRESRICVARRIGDSIRNEQNLLLLP